MDTQPPGAPRRQPATTGLRILLLVLGLVVVVPVLLVVARVLYPRLMF